MNKLQKSIASAVAAGSLLLQVGMPVLASTTTLEISGNGQNSDNDVKVGVVNSTTVVQSNNADINNDVEINSNTGNNSASDNSGDVEIDTGDVDAEVAITNTANTNVAEVDGCCEQDVDVLIEDNGRNSDNDVDLTTGSQTGLFQDNSADVKNEVEFNSNTGGNDADDNGGEVTIKTGDVDASADIENVLNSNSAMVHGSGSGFEVSARIVGNLRDTDNTIDLDVVRSVLLTQDNEADVENDVEANSNTGDNSADDNHGEVSIDTGDVDVKAMVDTAANFNWADVDCDCIGDVWAKVADNLRDSDNEIKAAIVSDLAVFQANCGEGVQAGDLGGDHEHHRGDCDLNNNIDADSNTGSNESDDNGGGDHDPDISTGSVDAEVDLHNSGNTNVYGESDGWEFAFPWLGESIVVNVNLSL